MRLHKTSASKHNQNTLDQVVFGILFAFTPVAARYGGQLSNICISKHIRQIHVLSPHRFTTIMGNTAYFIPFIAKKITRSPG